MKKMALLLSVLSVGTLPALAQECVVVDKSGSPLNVRYQPNGKVAQTVAKGEKLYSGVYTPTIDNHLKLPKVKDSQGRDWQYVALSNPNDIDQESGGWVLASLIRCK